MGQGQHRRRGHADRVTFGQVLGEREYRYLFRAQVLSLLGDRIAAVAMSVLVFDRTHSSLLAAATYAASYLPYVVGGPVLATLADRMPRRRLMLLADLSRAVLVAVMALPAVPTGALFGLLMVVTAIQPGFDAARGALVPQIFPARDEMAVAIQIGRLVNQGSQLLGFLAGGALLAVMSPHASLGLDAASFAASATLVRLGVRDRAASAQPRGSFRADMTAGARLVLRDSLLRRVALGSSLLASVLVMTEGVAVPEAHALHGGSVVVGLLTAAGPGGLVVALVLMQRLVRPGRQFHLMRRWAPLSALFLVVPLAHPTLVVTVVCWALAGTGNCFSQPANALFVRLVPDPFRGRALGFVQLLFVVGQGLALLVAGALAGVLAPDQAMAIDGAAGALVLGLTLLPWPPRERTIRLPDADAPADLADRVGVAAGPR